MRALVGARVWMNITPPANGMQTKLAPKAQHCMQTQLTLLARGMQTQFTLKAHNCMLTQLASPARGLWTHLALKANNCMWTQLTSPAILGMRSISGLRSVHELHKHLPYTVRASVTRHLQSGNYACYLWKQSQSDTMTKE